MLHVGHLLTAHASAAVIVLRHMNRSQRTSVAQKTQVDQNTICAVLFLSVAFFNSLFPVPTFSAVENESTTSWSMCSDCTLRLVASVVCNSEISSSDFSAVLSLMSVA